MDDMKIDVTLKARSREESVTVDGDGALVLMMNKEGGKSRMVLVGYQDWRTIIRDLLLCGMPKGYLILALLFGVRAKVENEER